MNHNPNQEPNSILSRLTDGFNDEFISQMKAAREAQKTSEEKEAAYRQIEKEAAKTYFARSLALNPDNTKCRLELELL